MEIIIGLIVIGFAAALFFNFRKKDEPLVVSAPYKVEDTPAPVAEPEVVVVVENAIVPEAVVEAPAKPARKPRAPKAEAAVEKKPVAKKAVAKKPAAKKPAARKPAVRTVAKSKKV